MLSWRRHPGWLSLLCLFAACGGRGNYTRSVHGTEGGYSLADAEPNPPSLMVARKNERPLYIVLDPNKVEDTFAVETAACETGSRGCERFSIFDVQTFVSRDLKRALGDFFSGVTVISPATPLPQTPHVVAHVKVDDIRLRELHRGALSYTLIEMTWALALLRSEDQDYAYSFAGTATSDDTYRTFEAGLESLVENAISSMLQRWTEERGPEAMNAATAAAAE